MIPNQMRQILKLQGIGVNRMKAIQLITLVLALGFAAVLTLQAAPVTAASQPKKASEQQMRSALQAYIDLFNSHDGKGLAALFADNARIEDPVGGERIVEGRAAIDEFYRGAVTMVDRLELVAPIRASHGASAAMAFDIHMQDKGQPILIRVIDVMTFDANGKIVDMKAYHGPGDRQAGDAGE